MRIVQPAGDFLAVTGDEWHGRAFVEQRDSGHDLFFFTADFFGNPEGDTGFSSGHRAVFFQKKGELCAIGSGISRRDVIGKMKVAPLWRIGLNGTALITLLILSGGIDENRY